MFSKLQCVELSKSDSQLRYDHGHDMSALVASHGSSTIFRGGCVVLLFSVGDVAAKVRVGAMTLGVIVLKVMNLINALTVVAIIILWITIRICMANHLDQPIKLIQ